MPRSTPRACVLIATSIALAGCREQEVAPPPPVSPPDMQLVSAGNEPRRVLAYHLDADTFQHLEVDLDSEVDANEIGGPMPTVVMRLTIRVVALMPLGYAMIRASVEDVRAIDTPNSQVPAASLSPALLALKGFSIAGVLAPNGRFGAAKLEGLAAPIQDTVSSIVSSFEQTMMPLPDEPVGVGAVWRNSRALDNVGLHLKAVNTVTVTAIDHDLMTYTLETDVHGDDQSVTQGDVTIAVKDITGTGSGKGTIDLRTLAITSEQVSELRTVMTAPSDVEPTKMTMATIAKIRPAGLVIH